MHTTRFTIALGEDDSLEAIYLLADSQQEAAHAHAATKAHSAHIAANVLHCVKDGQAGHNLHMPTDVNHQTKVLSHAAHHY